MKKNSKIDTKMETKSENNESKETEQSTESTELSETKESNKKVKTELTAKEVWDILESKKYRSEIDFIEEIGFQNWKMVINEILSRPGDLSSGSIGGFKQLFETAYELNPKKRSDGSKVEIDFSIKADENTNGISFIPMGCRFIIKKNNSIVGKIVMTKELKFKFYHPNENDDDSIDSIESDEESDDSSN